MPNLVNTIIETVGTYLPNLVAAIGILIGGWIIAMLLAGGVRKLLQSTSLDERIAGWLGYKEDENNLQVEQIVSRVVYYIVLLFVLLAVFEALQLTIITQPLNELLNTVFSFIPSLFAAGILLLIAWLLATGLRFLVSRALKATTIDDRLSAGAGLEDSQGVPLSDTLANVIYWFIFLLFLPLILDALGLQDALAPVQAMLNTLLGYLPNVLGAVVIFLVGWFVARIVRQIVTGLLTAANADAFGERFGLQNLTSIVGTVIYTLILIPTLISSLNALQIEAISGPATSMLEQLLSAIPNIFGAAIILIATYFIASLVSGLVVSLLSSIGFNSILSLIGIGSDPEEGQRTPSEIVGYLITVGLMLFATIEAANLMGFGILAELVATFLSFAGQVLLGVIILGLGLYFASLVYNVVLNTAGKNASLLARAAQYAVVIFSAAMALRQMGIANDIVNLAFGLLLGAVAVAVAIAFGLGSKDIAAREVENMLTAIRSEDSDSA